MIEQSHVSIWKCGSVFIKIGEKIDGNFNSNKRRNNLH